MDISQRSPWDRHKITVGSSSTGTVFSVPEQFLESIHLHLVVYNKSEQTNKHLEMKIGKKSGDLVWQKYGIGGDNIDVIIDPSLASGNVKLDVTNNEAYDLDVDCIKAVLGIN